MKLISRDFGWIPAVLILSFTAMTVSAVSCGDDDDDDETGADDDIVDDDTSDDDSGDDDDTEGGCASNDDCDVFEYCAKDVTLCDEGTGVCNSTEIAVRI